MATRGIRDGTNIQLNGVDVATHYPQLNLIEGAGIDLTVTEDIPGAVADVTFAVSSGASSTHSHTIPIKDEGVSQGNASSFDFVGSGVSAAVAGGVATVTVTSGGGGGDSLLGWVGL